VVTGVGARDLFYEEEAQVGRATATESAGQSANGNVGFNYRILRRSPGGAAIEVDPDTTFRSGDRIRFAFEPNADGFLYVVQQGSSGRWSMLLPHPQINGGRNDVTRFRPVTIPPSGWFRFDDTAGTERVFVYLSREPVPTLPGFDGPVAAMASVEPTAMLELTRSVRPRDLVFEKEAEPARTPDGAAQAVYYVVNQDEAGRAAWGDFGLRHR